LTLALKTGLLLVAIITAGLIFRRYGDIVDGRRDWNLLGKGGTVITLLYLSVFSAGWLLVSEGVSFLSVLAATSLVCAACVCVVAFPRRIRFTPEGVVESTILPRRSRALSWSQLTRAVEVAELGQSGNTRRVFARRLVLIPDGDVAEIEIRWWEPVSLRLGYEGNYVLRLCERAVVERVVKKLQARGIPVERYEGESVDRVGSKTIGI